MQGGYHDPNHGDGASTGVIVNSLYESSQPIIYAVPMEEGGGDDLGTTAVPLTKNIMYVSGDTTTTVPLTKNMMYVSGDTTTTVPLTKNIMYASGDTTTTVPLTKNIMYASGDTTHYEPPSAAMTAERDAGSNPRYSGYAAPAPEVTA